MKKRHVFCLAAAASLFLLLTAGCGVQRVVWSPDGARAAVLGDKGLYLSDGEGKVSALLVSNVALAEWFPDSRRLAFVTVEKFQSWKDFQAQLHAGDSERIIQSAQPILQVLNAGGDWKTALNSALEQDAVALYLKGLEGVQDKAGADFAVLAQKEASLYRLQVGTATNDQVFAGPALVQTLQKPVTIRLSPNGSLIAVATDMGKKGARLLVLPADRSAPPQIVAEAAAGHPDWSKDSRFLLYIHAIGSTTSDDDLLLGALTRRQVVNAAGAIEISTNHEDLAGMIFDSSDGVRCLSDGRILFVAAEVHLPTTALDMPQLPQIFALDPLRQATITALIPRSVQENLPQGIGFFDLSPDEKKVLMAAGKGGIVILTLASGELTTVQAAGKDDSPSFPSWRSGDELCYLSAAATNTAGHTWEVALWHGGINRILSAQWPDEIRKGFLEK